MLSRSVPETVLVLVGGAIILSGSLYGMAVGLTELLSPPPTGPTPAGNSNVPGSVVAILLIGSTIAVLGGQLVGYAR